VEDEGDLQSAYDYIVWLEVTVNDATLVHAHDNVNELHAEIDDEPLRHRLAPLIVDEILQVHWFFKISEKDT